MDSGKQTEGFRGEGGGHVLHGGARASWGRSEPLRDKEASGKGRFRSGWCLNRVSPSTLTVPFRSPLEAEMACRSLAPHAQRHRGVVQKELTVNGSTLAVRWTAEDPVFFRISINSFLDQLSLVIRNIRGLGPRLREA
uniref:L antigen family member 3 n=1 Tax=Ursus maritimus TaxID=29073 RepID=A0A452UPZ6_URSMA